MKASCFYGAGQPFKVEEIPRPEVSADEVLIKVKAAGICHGELHAQDGTLTPSRIPMVLGHEISGEIAGMGRDVKDFQIGDRVLVHVLLACGKCEYCVAGTELMCVDRGEIGLTHDGGLAEYTKAPIQNVFKIPDELSFEEAAILTDSLAAPFNAVQRADIRLGYKVAVYGVGGLGLNVVQLSKMRGAGVIAVDIFDGKLENAKGMGADFTVNAREKDPVQAVKDHTGGYGAHIAFEVVGTKETIEQAVRSVRRGGKIIVIGGGGESFSVPIRYLLWNDLTIKAGFASPKSNIPVLIELVRTGKINLKKVITHRFPLTEINTALKVLREGIGSPGRIIITP